MRMSVIGNYVGKDLGFFIDVGLLIFTFVLMVKYRERLAKLFTWMPLPKFLVYLISSLPFMIFEENINCLPTGCKLIPWTIPFLLGLVFILWIVGRRLSMMVSMILFMVVGVSWEIFFGGLRGVGFGPFGVFMTAFAGLSYAYLVVVPLTILKS